MEKRFIRVRSAKDIVISVSFLIVGLALVAIPEAAEANLGGYTLIATGLMLGCLLRNGYKEEGTNHKYVKKDFSFLGDMKNPILQALASTPESIDLSKEGKGQVLMLRMYYGKTSGKAYMQLFEYVPHQYEPCSRMYEYEISQVWNLFK